LRGKARDLQRLLAMTSSPEPPEPLAEGDKTG
jgi:hypothetical protein